MATQHALSLPELLSIILAYVHEDQSLFTCMLVNSLWAAEAASIQWADQPPLPRLETIHPERQQYYANKVRNCSIRLDTTVGSVLSFVNMRNLAFPRLDTVKLAMHCTTEDFMLDENMMHPFLPPTLRVLHIPGYMSSRINEKLLPMIATRCCRLKSVGVTYTTRTDLIPLPKLRAAQSVDALMELFRALPSAEELDLVKMDITVPLNHLTYLARRPLLRSLSLELQPVGTGITDFLTNSQLAMFPDLRELTLRAPVNLAITLCRRLQAISILRIQISAPLNGDEIQKRILMDEFFSTIMYFPALQKLELSFGFARDLDFREEWYDDPRQWFPLTSRSLSALATHCRHLRTLLFSRNVDSSRLFTSTDISNSDILYLASNLPHLRFFEYSVEPIVKRTYQYLNWPSRTIHSKSTQGKCFTASLIALGTHCQSLEYLQFTVPIDLRELNLHERPLFPKLRQLWLCNGTFSLSSSLTEGLSPIIPILEYHFPNLKSLTIPTSQLFGEEFGEEFREDCVYYPPWELAEIFTRFGPIMVNGFHGYMEPEFDGWFEEAEQADEPSVWGDGLDESEDGSEDEPESDTSDYNDKQT